MEYKSTVFRVLLCISLGLSLPTGYSVLPLTTSIIVMECIYSEPLVPIDADSLGD